MWSVVSGLEEGRCSHRFLYWSNLTAKGSKVRVLRSSTVHAPLSSFSSTFHVVCQLKMFTNTVSSSVMSGVASSGELIEPSVLPKRDRKSTRLNSSHANISYAVFCLKKKKTKMNHFTRYHNVI